MKIPFGKPLIGKDEYESVKRVLDSKTLVHGPISIEFEKLFADFTGAKAATSVSSCTAGMHLVYFTLGIGKGDEVIVSSQTHVATAHAIELTGAKPIFIDSCESDGNIDCDLIEEKITKKTKAIAIVHYLGIPVNMDKVMKIAKKYKLFVLEDCALSIGAKINNIHTGLIGDVGVFSFYPVKHMTSGEGGMIIFKSKKLFDKVKLKKAFGVTKTHTERSLPGLYNVNELGFNYRMSEIHAAIGVTQIKKLPSFLKAREENYSNLLKNLSTISEIDLIPENQTIRTSSRYCLSIILNKNCKIKRAEIMKQLSDFGIGTSIYYPHPVPRLNYYKKKYRYEKYKFINAEKFSDKSICLPVGPHLSNSHMKFIASKIKLILSK